MTWWHEERAAAEAAGGPREQTGQKRCRLSWAEAKKTGDGRNWRVGMALFDDYQGSRGYPSLRTKNLDTLGQEL